MSLCGIWRMLKGRRSRFHPGWSLRLLLGFPTSRSVGCPGLLQGEHSSVLLCSWLIYLLGFFTVLHLASPLFPLSVIPSSLFPRFLPSFRQHRTAVTGLTFSPDGNFMFSSCLQGTLALYRLAARKIQVLRVVGKTLGLGLPFFFFCISRDILTPEPTQNQPAWSDISQ